MDFLKTDPLSIDLTNLTDRSEPSKNMYYDAINERLNFTDFYFATGKDILALHLYNPMFEGIDTDFIIWSPPIGYRNNREAWLSYDVKQEVLVNKNSTSTTGRNILY